jgi:hypothetical protein
VPLLELVRGRGLLDIDIDMCSNLGVGYSLDDWVLEFPISIARHRGSHTNCTQDSQAGEVFVGDSKDKREAEISESRRARFDPSR